MKKNVATLGLLGVFLATPSAHANGRFPSAGHIEVDPADPAHIVVRATYGLVVTRDGGNRWDWICEKAMSYSGVWDPPIGITSEGKVLVGLPDGLSVSTPDTCSFSRAMALEGKLVADLAVDKKNQARGVVLTSLPLGQTFDTRLYVTEDGGLTFSQVGAVFPENLRGLTVDLCPSDPKVIYVSGVLTGASPQGVVMRSINGGTNYDTFVVPSSGDTQAPFLGAVDPNNANRVYVRLDGTPGRLFVSENGGQDWTLIFSGDGTLLGFGLSPDGNSLVVGGEKDGLWRSPTSKWAFEQTSLVRAKCLRWADAGVYACAEPVLDGFSVGISKTEGSTFKSLAGLSDVCGPLSCAKSLCSADWPQLRDTLGAKSCNDGASSGTSSGTSSGSGGMGGSAGTGGAGGIAPISAVGGCSCRFTQETTDSTIGMMLPAIALGFRRKRRVKRFGAQMFRPNKKA